MGRSIFMEKYRWKMNEAEKFIDDCLAVVFPDEMEYASSLSHYAFITNIKGVITAIKKCFTRIPPRHLPDFIGKHGAYKAYLYRDTIDFNFGYNPPLREEMKKLMHKWGWRICYEDLEKGNDVVKFVKPDEMMKVILKFDHYAPGSTCKRVKIGSRQVVEDIYEIVCNEGAAEMGF